MRKILHEVVYWNGFYKFDYPSDINIKTNWKNGVFMVTMCILWNIVSLIFIGLKLYTNIHIKSLLIDIILNTQLLIISVCIIIFIIIIVTHIMYKIIFYKINLKMLEKYYQNLPIPRRKTGARLTGICMIFLVFLPFIFKSIFIGNNKLHTTLAEQKVDTFYLDRLPAEANLLLPKKDTTKSSNQ